MKGEAAAGGVGEQAVAAEHEFVLAHLQQWRGDRVGAGPVDGGADEGDAALLHVQLALAAERGDGEPDGRSGDVVLFGEVGLPGLTCSATGATASPGRGSSPLHTGSAGHARGLWSRAHGVSSGPGTPRPKRSSLPASRKTSPPTGTRGEERDAQPRRPWSGAGSTGGRTGTDAAEVESGPRERGVPEPPDMGRRGQSLGSGHACALDVERTCSSDGRYVSVCIYVEGGVVYVEDGHRYR